MHGLHTTAWVFDTTDYKAIKVIDQYRDADHALAGALRIIKGIMEEVSSEYTINFLNDDVLIGCLLYTSPSPRDDELSRMPSSA